MAEFNQQQTYLGIELGSTRIKAVLIDERHRPIANGSHTWENRLENGVWTYSEQDIWQGLAACYSDLARDVKERFGQELTAVGTIGISAMMHGYVALDKNGCLLTPFRTWRNTVTGQATAELTQLFNFNIPQRWSVSHLYQAMLNREAHVNELCHLFTLAGYIHWKLTGVKAVGVGEASGMFPIDMKTQQYDAAMLDKFDKLAAERPWKLSALLPTVLPAGAPAGCLTEEGAGLLDASGRLTPGIPFCPAEGDAGTGMVATNSVAPRTGNVSAGTSVFAMAVLEAPLSRVYPEIDMVTTPAGDPVAMVHCNNCSSDIDAWIALFGEAAAALGAKADAATLYNTLFNAALSGEPDCGGLLAYNYLSGEHVTGFTEGRPLVARLPEAKLTLANFMRAQLFTACGALKTGMDILANEHVNLSGFTGHGGFFKVSGVGQRVMAAALGVPVTVMSTAGEGGPWGMAILAAFSKQRGAGESLPDYLKHKVFAEANSLTEQPNAEDAAGFAAFMQRYGDGLPIERAAVENLK